MLALAAAACGEGSPSSQAVSDPARTTIPAVSSKDTVTLITGDRISLVKTHGHATARIQRGPGRQQVAFEVQERGDQLTVIPSDVAAQVAGGQLDRALFDVTQLITDGYGDDQRDDLPLIITGQADPPALRSRLAGVGVTVDHIMPALHAMAVRQHKASGGAVLAGMRAVGSNAWTAAAAPTAKIWLDRKRSVHLDRSVPEIGAPAAYARGFTGAGVTVAVLDTGIDTTHPDLATKVVAAEDFVFDGLGTSDGFGHGTHVASIGAGTGAASDGRFHGVAPDAALLNGKVCDRSGSCFDSSVLAGMEWAVVTQHARIINLSLGGTDTPGVDPLEEAVNQLSAQYGALFVIAAGNSGFASGTVESPGSADAALTVGAIDRDERRASFSGQGPRVGDHAIKPDIVAPGVSIVAARAANTALGPAVGDFYVQLSGTSMATPHVAGAAAILLQQHPDWTGEQLKQALMGAAQPIAFSSVFEQGAGRVNVDRVTRQLVTVEPASLSMGIQVFPHDDDPLITRVVRYHNAGSSPVVLTLAATLTPQGELGATPGMVAVAPATLTVPAGGLAEATVTVDTRVDGPDRDYGGTLIARGTDIRLFTPVAVEREPKSHNLTVSIVDAGGNPTSASVNIRGVGSSADAASAISSSAFIVGETTLRLPDGAYTITALQFTDIDHASWTVAPRAAVADVDATVVMDARLARPVALTVPDPDMLFGFQYEQFDDLAHDFHFGVAAFVPVATGQIGPSAPPGETESMLSVLLASSFDAPRVVDHLARVEPDRMVTGWTRAFRPSDLATVTAHHAAARDELLARSVLPLPTSLFSLGIGFLYTGPFEQTEHNYGPGLTWDVEVDQARRDPEFPGGAILLASERALREYRPGQSYVESWNQAPFGPCFAGAARFIFLPPFTTPARIGDLMVFAPALFSGKAAPPRDSVSPADQGRLTLRKNGEIIDETDEPEAPLLFSSVPAEPAQYELEADVVRSTAISDLSTRVTVRWTFGSQHVDDTVFRLLPLLTMRFLPPLDEHNESAAASLVMPIRFEHPIGAPTPRITRAAVAASFDDGASWANVPVLLLGDQALAVIDHRPGATHVSLRGSAADVDGNAVEQTIIRAYRLASD